MVEYDGDDGRGEWYYWQIGQKVVKKSKNYQKSFKDLKNLQKPSVRKNVYQNTNPPSIRYKELELLLQLSDSFSSSFC